MARFSSTPPGAASLSRFYTNFATQPEFCPAWVEWAPGGVLVEVELLQADPRRPLGPRGEA